MARKRQQPKLSITTIEGTKIGVTASYNPKEIGVDKSVPWSKSPKSSGDLPDLEFVSAEGRSMSFELMFDTFETKRNVHTEFVGDLMKLTLADAAMKRPPKVAVNWGNDRLLEFQGVIESVSTKYTMFLPDGTPVRATCHVAIREAGAVSFKEHRLVVTGFDVLVDSHGLPAGDVVAFVVDRDLDQPGMCVVTLRNMRHEQNNRFKLGTAVEVRVRSRQCDSGSGETAIAVFKGELVGMEPSYAQSGDSTLSLRALDKLHRLQRVRRSAVYQDQSDQDIASAIASQHGLSAQCGSTPRIKHAHVYQHNQTDLEFLRQRADRIGYSVWCEDTKLYFDAPRLDTDSGLHFAYGYMDKLELVRFAARLSNTQVVKKVIVRGRNPDTKEEIVGEAASAQRSPLGSSTAASSLGDFDAVTTYTVDHPIFSVEEANAIAAGKLAESALSFLTAEAESLGDARVKPGIVVKITVNEVDANDRFNGKYFVRGCIHLLTANGGYTTTMRLARDAEGGS